MCLFNWTLVQRKKLSTLRGHHQKSTPSASKYCMIGRFDGVRSNYCLPPSPIMSGVVRVHVQYSFVLAPAQKQFALTTNAGFSIILGVYQGICDNGTISAPWSSQYSYETTNHRTCFQSPWRKACSASLPVEGDLEEERAAWVR